MSRPREGEASLGPTTSVRLPKEMVRRLNRVLARRRGGTHAQLLTPRLVAVVEALERESGLSVEKWPPPLCGAGAGG